MAAAVNDESANQSETGLVPKSYYIDGARKLDVRAMLKEAANKYAISSDPADYIYECIRANTTNVPNENHDAFSKAELLRFDTRYASPFGDKVGMPVYMTYIGKPHHLNHKCFREGTPVVMADGTSKPIESVRVGDKVLDKNGHPQDVEAAWNEGVPAKLVKVTTKNYGTFYATESHDFPAWTWPRECSCGCGQEVKPGRAYARDHYKGGRIGSGLVVVDGSAKRNGGERRIPRDHNPVKRIPAAQLRAGDCLFIPETFEARQVAENIQPGKARLLGYYVAEACASDEKWTVFNFGFHELDTWIKDVRSLCSALDVATRLNYDYAHGSASVSTSNENGQTLHTWFKAHGGEYAPTKCLSMEVMHWPLFLKKELIKGLFRGDGSQFYRRSQHKKKSYSQFVGAFTTVSPKLSSQVRVLLHQLGIPSTVSVQLANGVRKHDAYQLRVHGSFATKLASVVWEDAALAQLRKPTLAANQVRDTGENLLIPITSVELVENDKPVYNLTVAESHSYQINGGLATFNCDDPLRARGVILDAHYNDDAPALEHCATCNHRTADEAGRDQSGIHCIKCASVVKDEFVEILVAVDGKKDPRLVREIQAGALNAGSMGCNCSSTSCNVCGHIARNVNEFCAHIRGSAKGSLWERQAGTNKFTKTSADKVRAALKSAGLKPDFVGNRLVSVSLTIPERDFEVRKAFEYCQGVEFDEYSRVHRPADPKARSIEILKAAESHLTASITIDEETEQLIRRARLTQLETSVAKNASSANDQTYFAVRVNGNDEDIHVTTSLEGATKMAQLGVRDRAEYLELEAPSAKSALTRAISASLSKSAQYLPMTSDVNLVVPDGVKVHLDQNGQTQMQPGQDSQNGPGGPGGMPGQGPAQGPGGPQQPSIEDVTQQQTGPQGEPQQSPEEFGMLPPGASSDGLEQMTSSASGGMPQKQNQNQAKPGEKREEHMQQEQKYAAVYGDFDVEVFDDKAILCAPGGEVFQVKSAKSLGTDQEKRQFGGAIIDSVMEKGLVRTALKFGGEFSGEFSKRLADSTQGAMFDFSGGRPMSSGGSLEGHMEPQREVHQEGSDIAKRPGATKDYDDDMQATRPDPKNSIESRDTDMADEAAVASPKTNAVDGHEEPQREKRPEYTQEQNGLAGATTDMKANAGGDSTPKIASAAAPVDESKKALERQRKLHASQMERMKADHEAEKSALVKAEQEKIFRALRIAQRRGALNLETSPLKATVLDSLTVARPLGRSASTGQSMEFAGIDEGLALHLVEASWAQSANEEVESLIQRAAELMSYDDKYLVSAEKDLSKQAAVIPQVFDEEQMNPVDEVQRRSASLRARANEGNMILAPGTTDSGMGVGEDKLSAIRAALGPTRVGRMLSGTSELGAPEDFRPSA